MQSEYKTSEARRRYARMRYHDRMAELRDQLGGKCSVCGACRHLEFFRHGGKGEAPTITRVHTCRLAVRDRALEGVVLICKECRLIAQARAREIQIQGGDDAPPQVAGAGGGR